MACVDFTEMHNGVLQVGSVDEESTKSDEEYDDLAMQDMQQNGYWSDDDEETRERQASKPKECSDSKYSKNLDQFLKSSNSEQLSEPLCSYSSLLIEKSNHDQRMLSSLGKMRKRSLSIPAYRKHGSGLLRASR